MKAVTFLFLFILPFILSAQTYERVCTQNGNNLSFYNEFIDSIVPLMIDDRIDVYDENLELTDAFIRKSFYQLDTTVNCSWSRPRFIDNVFYGGLDGVPIKSLPFLDTMTFLLNPKYISFFEKLYDDYDNFLGTEIRFLIKKNAQPRARKVQKYPSEILTSDRSYWINDCLIFNGQIIELDSCHKLYRLQFFEDRTFKQSFSKNGYECHTQDMEHHIECGVEGSIEGSRYFYRLEGHYICQPFGDWEVIDNQLFLKAGIDFVQFNIIKVTDSQLILKFKEQDYEIQLKKYHFK